MAIFCQNHGFLIGHDGELPKTLFFTARNGLVRARARPEPAREKLKHSVFFDFWPSIFGLRRIFFPCVLSGGREARFCDFGAVWVTAFAVFVGQKQCFCTLPRLDVFARTCKKTSQVPVFLATMSLKKSRIAVF